MSNRQDEDKKKLKFLSYLAIALLVLGLILYVLNPDTVIQLNVVDFPHDLITMEE